MTVSETAKKVAEGYLGRHPEDEGDKHGIHRGTSEAV